MNILPEVSVIVPVYNAEKYLCQCIESILSQTYRNIELLLVNDGSTDTSAILCETYARKDSRVKVYHQKNKGVGSARNYGIHRAIGRWVTFVDADDWVNEDLIENYISCVDIGVDMVISLCYANDNHGFCKSNYLNKEDAIRSLITFNEFPASMCLSMYLREKMQHVHLDESIHYWEDFYFQFSYLLHVDKISVNKIPSYNYRRHSESATHSDLNPKMLTCLSIPECMKVQLENHGYNSKSIMPIISEVTVFFIGQCFKSFLLSSHYNERDVLILINYLRKHKRYLFRPIKSVGVKMKTILLLNLFMSNLNSLLSWIYKKVDK